MHSKDASAGLIVPPYREEPGKAKRLPEVTSFLKQNPLYTKLAIYEGFWAVGALLSPRQRAHFGEHSFTWMQAALHRGHIGAWFTRVGRWNGLLSRF